MDSHATVTHWSLLWWHGTFVLLWKQERGWGRMTQNSRKTVAKCCKKPMKRAESSAIAVLVSKNVFDLYCDLLWRALWGEQSHVGEQKAADTQDAQVGTGSAQLACAEVTPRQVNAGGPESNLGAVSKSKINKEKSYDLGWVGREAWIKDVNQGPYFLWPGETGVTVEEWITGQCLDLAATSRATCLRLQPPSCDHVPRYPWSRFWRKRRLSAIINSNSLLGICNFKCTCLVGIFFTPFGSVPQCMLYRIQPPGRSF